MSTKIAHHTSIEYVPPSSTHNGVRVLHGGHRARCTCLWSSDCYSQLSDTQRAIEVHLRRANRLDFDALITKSSIGAAIADIKKRGIDAHLVDLEREMRRWRSSKKSKTKGKRSPEDAAKKLSPEDAARKLSPEDAAKKLSPEDAARKLSPEDAAKKLSPEDAAKKLFPRRCRKEAFPRRCRKEASPEDAAKKLSPEDAAFMRGFGTALASIWRCHHDGQMVTHLIKQNNFKLSSFRGIGMFDEDYKAICKAVRR